MTVMTGHEIRQKFLDYFAERGHRVVRSSPLLPANDPTLLFTNAGMNQFKDVFLGAEQRDYKRATTSQKCVRAGGKHNDLENDDAEELWQKIAGVSKDRIFRLDEKDNFWQMGETGPCGPCSEIHFDLGP